MRQSQSEFELKLILGCLFLVLLLVLKLLGCLDSHEPVPGD